MAARTSRRIRILPTPRKAARTTATPAISATPATTATPATSATPATRGTRKVRTNIRISMMRKSQSKCTRRNFSKGSPRRRLARPTPLTASMWTMMTPSYLQPTPALKIGTPATPAPTWKLYARRSKDSRSSKCKK